MKWDAVNFKMNYNLIDVGSSCFWNWLCHKTNKLFHPFKTNHSNIHVILHAHIHLNQHTLTSSSHNTHLYHHKNTHALSASHAYNIMDTVTSWCRQLHHQSRTSIIVYVGFPHHSLNLTIISVQFHPMHALFLCTHFDHHMLCYINKKSLPCYWPLFGYFECKTLHSNHS